MALRTSSLAWFCTPASLGVHVVLLGLHACCRGHPATAVGGPGPDVALQTRMLTSIVQNGSGRMGLFEFLTEENQLHRVLGFGSPAPWTAPKGRVLGCLVLRTRYLVLRHQLFQLTSEEWWRDPEWRSLRSPGWAESSPCQPSQGRCQNDLLLGDCKLLWWKHGGQSEGKTTVLTTGSQSSLGERNALPKTPLCLFLICIKQNCWKLYVQCFINPKY